LIFFYLHLSTKRTKIGVHILNMRKKSTLTYILSFIGLLLPIVTFANTGTIDPNFTIGGTDYHHSRLCNPGTITDSNTDCHLYTRVNWKPTSEASVDPVIVTDDRIYGRIWSGQIGWINLSPATAMGLDPTNVGVHNDNAGHLSKFAWGSIGGWINFSTDPITSAGPVRISTSTGEFSGAAWVQNYGWMLFDCNLADACVKTDWVPTVVVSTSTATSTTGGGGDDDDGHGHTHGDGGGGKGGGTTGGGHGNSGIKCKEPEIYNKLINECVIPASLIRPKVSPPVITAGPIINVVHFTPKEVKKTIKEILNTPEIKDFAQTTTLLGFLGQLLFAIFSGFIFTPLAVTDGLLLLARGWALVMTALGFKKRRKSWGHVYNSVTKQPIYPAYVTLRSGEGEDVASAITDHGGGYSFPEITTPGMYSILVKKVDFIYPSQKLVGRDHDEVYRDLYFGEYFRIDNPIMTIDRNIPIDPEKFDWNTFEKRERYLTRLYTLELKWFSTLSDIFYAIGFITATIVTFASPTLYNVVVFGIYTALYITRRRNKENKPYGHILFKDTKDPLPFAILRVMSADTHAEVVYRITDITGRYFCHLPNGNYLVRVDKKVLDGTYKTVAENIPVVVDKNYLAETFYI
jgi:hypothetical protein